MIKVLYRPGCYGAYLSSLLNVATNLSTDTAFVNLDPVTGSSHARFVQLEVKYGFLNSHDITNKQIAKIDREARFYSNESILSTHQSSEIYDNDQVIIIEAGEYNWLEYANNHFVKHACSDIDFYIKIIGIDWFKYYGGESNPDFSNETLRWSTREFISFWLNDVCQTYTIPFNEVQGFRIYAQDLFEKFELTINSIITHFNLQYKMPMDQILTHHNKFVKLQKFHKIQDKCDSWVKDILNNVDSESPCLTILDEAYIQWKLRTLGWEIQCYNLNEFPKKSGDLKKLILPCEQV